MEQVVKMIDNLTPQQIELLMEYVEFAKRENTDHYPPVIKERLYDLEHGDEEALEVLNSCFHDLVRIERLNYNQARELAKIISQRDVVIRIDPKDIFLEKSDELLNEIRAEHRKRNPKTNGKEYLKVES